MKSNLLLASRLLRRCLHELFHPGMTFISVSGHLPLRVYMIWSKNVRTSKVALPQHIIFKDSHKFDYNLPYHILSFLQYPPRRSSQVLHLHLQSVLCSHSGKQKNKKVSWWERFLPIFFQYGLLGISCCVVLRSWVYGVCCNALRCVVL